MEAIRFQKIVLAKLDGSVITLVYGFSIVLLGGVVALTGDFE